MQAVTTEDRRKELATLLKRMEAQPSHDWTRERERVVVLRQMIAGDARESADREEAMPG